MADSVYISSNLTSTHIEFIHLLDEYEIDMFSMADIERQLNCQFKNLNEILENLVDKRMLFRLERGKFCRPNFNDDNAIGCFLVPDGTVSYWSALNKHGLTEQFPNVLFIQTTKNKPDKNIRGTNYKFIKIHPRKMFGDIKQGYGNRQFRITDIEKTIVDCFDLPQYSGGYAELIRAFGVAKLNGKKMTEYCSAINNIAITKRMGFLAEFLHKKGMETFIKHARQTVNTKYSVFDPLGINKGEFINDWKLRLNISKEEITDICNKQY